MGVDDAAFRLLSDLSSYALMAIAGRAAEILQGPVAQGDHETGSVAGGGANQPRIVREDDRLHSVPNSQLAQHAGQRERAHGERTR